MIEYPLPNFKKKGVVVKRIWKICFLILIFFLLCSSSLIKAEEKEIKITKKTVIYECNNVVRFWVETNASENQDIGIKIILIKPDGKNELVKEAVTQKFTKTNAPTLDMTGYEEGKYTFMIKVIYGQNWDKTLVEWQDFLYFACKE